VSSYSPVDRNSVLGRNRDFSISLADAGVHLKATAFSFIPDTTKGIHP
jgi:hypothetical protein